MVNPDIVAVSPNGLADMTSTLQRNINSSNNAVAKLRAAFIRANVPTASLDALYRTLGLAADELPMLKRRHELALKIDADTSDPFAGIKGIPRDMVAAGAGPITYADNMAASKAGTDDANGIARAFDKSKPGSPGIKDISSILQHIKANSGDSYYAAALINKLGPQTVAHLAALGMDLKSSGDAKGSDLVQSTVGGALALASQQIPDPEKWLNLVSVPGRTEPSTGFIAPLLKYGHFDPSFLERVGAHELNAATDSPDIERSAEIWTAIAKSPNASALFYSMNLPEIMAYAKEDRLLLPHEGKAVVAFSQVTKAATIDIRKIDPRMADINVKAIVDYYKDHSYYHTYDSVRNVYADLIRERWNDLVYSISTPADLLTSSGDDPTREGVELPPDSWRGILTDTMRHGPAAAELFSQALSWVTETQGDIDTKRFPKDHSMKTPDGQKPNFWESQNIDRIEALMNASGADALAQLKQKNEDLANNWIAGMKTVAAEIKKNKVNLLGYEKDLGKKWLTAQQAHLETYAKQLIKKNFGDVDEKAVGDIFNKTPFEYRKDWQRQAIAAWDAAVNQGYSGLGPVKYGGRPWTGDPREYEKKFNANITFTDGRHRVHLLDIEQISGDWRKLAAYNAWLQDPAVANAVYGSGPQ
jgi:hypothetical protein